MATDRTILLWPDTHIPDHNAKAVGKLLDWLVDNEHAISEIILLGDFLDCKPPARWSRGTAEEFAGNLQDEYDAGVKVLGILREIYDGPIKLHKGNHERRVDTYVHTKAQAFAGLRSLKLENELHLADFDIQLLGPFYNVAPGWVTTHGDTTEALKPKAGATALGLAQRLGVSVAMGHTHRLGWTPATTGVGKSRKVLYGLECGNLMDIRKADYLPGGFANWQTGFGLLHVHGKHVKPVAVPMDDNGFFIL